MKSGDILVAVHTMEGIHFCHEVLLLQLGAVAPKDLAGIDSAALGMGDKVHNPIVAMA